jgi:acyl-CoA synthetase (NDP forming)
MGAGQVEKGEDILNAAGIPTFKYPDRAARVLFHVALQREFARALRNAGSRFRHADGESDRERRAACWSVARKSRPDDSDRI